MDYQNLYCSIIINSFNRNLDDSYVEKHHILPKSLGGDNSDDNLARLTAREHFIVHYLLTKIYSDNFEAYNKMIYAFHRMCYSFNDYRECKYKINSKTYDYLRRVWNETQKHKKYSDEVKRKMSLTQIGNKKNLGKKASAEKIRKLKVAFADRIDIYHPFFLKNKRIKSCEYEFYHNQGYLKGKYTSLEQREMLSKRFKGRVFTDEHKAKIAMKSMGNKSNTGRIKSEETRRKLSIAGKGRKNKPITDKTRLKMSNSQKNVKHSPLSEETKRKIGLANSNRKMIRDEITGKITRVKINDK